VKLFVVLFTLGTLAHFRHFRHLSYQPSLYDLSFALKLIIALEWI